MLNVRTAGDAFRRQTVARGPHDDTAEPRVPCLLARLWSLLNFAVNLSSSMAYSSSSAAMASRTVW